MHFDSLEPFQATELWRGVVKSLGRCEGKLSGRQVCESVRSSLRSFGGRDCVDPEKIYKFCDLLVDSEVLIAKSSYRGFPQDVDNLFIIGENYLSDSGALPLASLMNIRQRSYSTASGASGRTPSAERRQTNLRAVPCTSTDSLDRVLFAESALRKTIEEFGIEEETISELALYRLLTLIEVPILDGILCLEQHRKARLLDFRKHPKPRPKTPEVPATVCDPWVAQGMRCLGTKEAKTVSHLSLPESRLHIFQQVLKRYRSEYTPLFPKRLADTILQIYHQLLSRSDKASHVLEACQLLAYLLPAAQRKALLYLLLFLNVVAKDAQRLDQNWCNMDVCLNAATDLALPPHETELSEGQRKHLLQFMISHAQELQVVPEHLLRELGIRASQRRYTVAQPKPRTLHSLLYCLLT